MTLKAMTANEKRPFNTLGKANHGWLNANHHFSFSSYQDPARMGWGNIRVWNDDEIAAQSGFPPHDHDNMEIITYVREGAITHKDSMGNIGRTEAGDVQVMSAGTGVTHSEYNLEDKVCRLFQIWILPRTQNVAPRWDARQFPKSDQNAGFTVLASGYGDEGALEINADARMLGATVAMGAHLHHIISPAHCAYLVVTRGHIEIDGVVLHERDGFAMAPGAQLSIVAKTNTQLVLVESY
jgi:redox-sensitive bicupin YhaK (pirin superfamily)